MIKLTDKIWKQITDINRQVNFAIEYFSDEEIYGVSEHWQIPTDQKGDCEDIQLMKQDLLKKQGIESFMATCWTETGGYHAVLLVDTDRGTFALDNRFETVWNYDELDYTWDKREVEGGKWVEILS